MDINKVFISKMLSSSLSDVFQVKFWDGTSKIYGGKIPKFTIIFNKPVSKAEIIKSPSITLGEAYMNKEIEIEGSIEDVVSSFYNKKHINIPLHNNLLKIALDNLKSSSSKNIKYHYDIGNDFYKIWLDKNMIYSCAYFKDQNEDINKAQENKIEYILRKLNLKQGMTLLDIGCGWGTLIFSAAKKYKAHAVGVTLSEEQYKSVSDKIKNEHLENQLSVKLCDYRELKNIQFDRIVSIGMIEHVGKHNLKEYFDIVNKLLKDGGLSLLHCITSKNKGCTNPWIEEYIFPGGYIPAIKDIVKYIAENDFEIIDIENLRRHYGKTLECWIKNFDNNINEIKENKNEKFIRMWQLYLNACAASFNYSNIQIHQFLFSKGINNDIPWTRDYLYK